VSHTGRYLRDLLPDIDLEGPRADREPAGTPDPEGDSEGEQATGAGAGDD
jgi:excinuclease ABC subunit A